jgi:GT2 family glycosyltransferase
MVDRESSAPRITAVIVSYNSETLLPDCLESLGAASGDQIELDVVVSDNASSDGSIDVVRRLQPDATIVASDRNRGYAAGINAGVRRARPSDAILILNDDIRMASGSIPTLFEALSEPSIGIAVPKLIDGSGELLRSLRREPTVLRVYGEALLGGGRSGKISALGEVIQSESVYNAPAIVTWASGCAWLISKACWDAVGEWDESFFLYAEDSDYALRSRDNGFAMRYVPDASAVHLVGPSHEDARLWTMSVWNRYRLYRRRHGPVSSGLFRLGLLLNESLRGLAGRHVHRSAAAAILDSDKLPEEVR